MKLDELKRLAEAATPGPWIARPRDSMEAERIRRGESVSAVALSSDKDAFLGWEIEELPEPMRGQFMGPDAAYITALSPERVLRLIAVIEAAKELRADGRPDRTWEESEQQFDAALAALENDQ